MTERVPCRPSKLDFFVLERDEMRPTPSTGRHADRSFSHAARLFRQLAATLACFTVLTAGCQNGGQSSSHARLPPEQELQPVGQETEVTSVDPRRLSREQLEASDGAKALKGIETNGLNYRE
jgi:hypothetical protein